MNKDVEKRLNHFIAVFDDLFEYKTDTRIRKTIDMRVLNQALELRDEKYYDSIVIDDIDNISLMR